MTANSQQCIYIYTLGKEFHSNKKRFFFTSFRSMEKIKEKINTNGISLSLLFFTLNYDTFGGYCSTKLLQRFLSFFQSRNFRVPSQHQQDSGNRSGQRHSKSQKYQSKHQI